MKLSVSVKQTSNKFANVEEAFLKAHKQKVEVGFFDKQGKHYSGYSYPQLMFRHEYGTESTPPRPVFRNASLSMQSALSNTKSYRARPLKEAAKIWKSRLTRKASPKIILEALGEFAAKEIHNVFGNPAYLTVTRNPTPLVKTGDLQGHIAYRTSLDGRVRLLT